MVRLRRGSDDNAPIRETHFHTSRMRDSVVVQKRHNYVLDDEEHHEEKGKLADLLVPSREVHIPSAESLEDLRNALANVETEDEEDEKANSAGAAAAVDVAKEEKATAKPTLARPCRSNLHDAECMSRKSCKLTESRRRVGFGTITVRDYGMILGDHPSCSYGPPVTLEWDYLEYEPLSVDEYEFHHSRRRPLRLLGLNYYQRKSILTTNTGHSEGELKAAVKEVKRVQMNRSITRHTLPFREVEYGIERAGRKLKKVLKKEEKRRVGADV